MEVRKNEKDLGSGELGLFFFSSCAGNRERDEKWWAG